MLLILETTPVFKRPGGTAYGMYTWVVVTGQETETEELGAV